MGCGKPPDRGGDQRLVIGELGFDYRGGEVEHSRDVAAQPADAGRALAGAALMQGLAGCGE